MQGGRATTDKSEPSTSEWQSSVDGAACLAIIAVLFIVGAKIMDSGNVDDHWGRIFLQEARRLHTTRTGQDVVNPTPHFHTFVYVSELSSVR